MSATYNYATKSELDRAVLEGRSYSGLNSNPYLFPKFRMGAWLPDGSITLADCTNPALQKLAGVSYQNISSGSRGIFVQTGSIEGAIASLGAAPGDLIYLGIPAGTFTKIDPTAPGVTSIVVGQAMTNPDTGLVTDLRIGFAGEALDSGPSGLDPSDVQNLIDADKLKSQRNGSGITIPALRLVAWKNTSEIEMAAANDITLSDIAGVTLASIISGAFGSIQTTGTIPEACGALGAIAGQTVYLSASTPGLMTLIPSSAPTDAIVRIGYAVPASGTTGAAVDLLLDFEILYSP